MKKTLVLGLFLAFASTAQAQVNLKSLESKAASTTTGQQISTLLTSLESNIKPEAKTTEFSTTKKTSWLDSAKKAATSEQGAALLTQLASGLKSSSFGSGWAAIKTNGLPARKQQIPTLVLKHWRVNWFRISIPHHSLMLIAKQHWTV